MPPLPEIEDLVQPQILIEELTFMNQQACVATLFGYRVNNLIKGNDFILEIRLVNTERQKRAGKSTRYCDLNFRQLRRIEIFVGDDNRTVVVPNRSSVGQQRILVSDIGVSMKADRGNVIGTLAGFFIQGLNV